MALLIRSKDRCDCSATEITPHKIWLHRRTLLKQIATASLIATTPITPSVAGAFRSEECRDEMQVNVTDRPTDLHAITHYNNYYEFSTEKEAIAVLAQSLTTSPWSIEIRGAVENPIRLGLDDIYKLCRVDRIYRLRCVEGWSMVIPWQGIELNKLIAKAKPLSTAKFVRFIGTNRPSEMVGQRRPTLSWPYEEALRIDEAMHPLTLLATGLYGNDLPKQNGAPVRLVVPWKYGFKSIKAIQSIELLEQQPTTTWQQASPKEYGFYANVMPDIPHPRWSQRREVRIGSTKKIKTLPFNGYAEQVAPLYAGMDLRIHY